MSKYLCADCVLREQCDGEWTMRCSRYVPKEHKQTNEEWLKSLDTEGMVDYLYEVHKGGASVERQAWIEKHKEQIKMQIRGWLKEKHHAN